MLFIDHVAFNYAGSSIWWGMSFRKLVVGNTCSPLRKRGSINIHQTFFISYILRLLYLWFVNAYISSGKSLRLLLLDTEISQDWLQAASTSSDLYQYHVLLLQKYPLQALKSLPLLYEAFAEPMSDSDELL
jgi:hypothetical protein